MKNEKIISELRELLRANNVKENSKKALNMEFSFLQGILSTCRLLKQPEPPMICMGLMSGRSILTF